MHDVQERLKQNGLSLFKIILTAICVLFGFVSVIAVICRREFESISHCLAEMALVCLPAVVGVLMKFKMNVGIYVFLHFYALSPLLGEVYNLYHRLPWWDDLLHFTGGWVFAIFGVFVFKFLHKHQMLSLKCCALFALTFSVFLSTVWEIYEYGCDTLFGTDMQKDTVVTSVDSYFLSQEEGEIGSVEGIEEVSINGKTLGVKGYLDIGLIDTMNDLMLATTGAMLYAIIFLLDRDRHPVFVPLKEKEPGEVRLYRIKIAITSPQGKKEKRG